MEVRPSQEPTVTTLKKKYDRLGEFPLFVWTGEQQKRVCRIFGTNNGSVAISSIVGFPRGSRRLAAEDDDLSEFV